MSLAETIADLPQDHQDAIIALHDDCEECLLADGAAPEDISYRFLRSHIVIQAITGDGKRHGFTITFTKRPPYSVFCHVHCINGPSDFQIHLPTI